MMLYFLRLLIRIGLFVVFLFFTCDFLGIGLRSATFLEGVFLRLIGIASVGDKRLF